MKKSAIFLFLLIGVVVSVFVCFLNIGRCLSQVDTLSHADLIVTLSGSNERVDKAISLLKAGIANKLAVTTNDAYKLALRRGVDPSSIVISRFFATTTYQEGLYIKELVESRKYRNVVIVSDPFHLCRVRWTIRSLCCDIGVKFYFDAPGYNESVSWWRVKESRLYVLSELSKLIYYWVWHGVLQQEQDPAWAVVLEKQYMRMLHQVAG